jgi:hypothetical protein
MAVGHSHFQQIEKQPCAFTATQRQAEQPVSDEEDDQWANIEGSGDDDRQHHLELA